MKKIIAFDLMSGDKGFEPAFNAAEEFLSKNQDYKIIAFVTGEIEIPVVYNQNIKFVICKDIISQTDGPMQIKRKEDSTLIKAIKSVLSNEADLVVSAASSGSLVTAGYVYFRTINANLRPAFSPIFTNIFGDKKILIDGGANANPDSDTLVTYAIMGTEYFKALGISNRPRVKLLNIGEEESKGNSLLKETHQKLKAEKRINFLGNIESDRLLYGDEDIIVSDGISGNIAIKAYEGSFNLVYGIMKESANKSLLTKIGLLFAKDLRKRFKNAFSGDDIGGAIVLGLNHLLIKVHGGSDTKYFLNSLILGQQLLENKLLENIKNKLKNEK
ncbi:phosphate acyltransferase PlsX [Candidatus Hepatoplasma crinochetorum]|uniref:phosphate acyltransferase PlsX n=1 Tax=Candidatus Hepatoplasma crinochetorum TaxID=295596 RepID=UPI003087D4EC|nr:MAG: phosphate acyltransferase [Candidatus Hepatoplasma crinochetorum]